MQERRTAPETPLAISPMGAAMANLFDDLGMDYQRAFEGRKQAQIDAVEQLTARLNPGTRVLDVGCATGRPTAEQLCEKGMDVTGIDVSDVMLEQARQQVPRARFLKADLFIDVPGLGTYDAIVSFFCLINLTETQFTNGLQRLAALTAPCGSVLVGVPERRGDEEVHFLDLSYRPIPCRREDLARWARRAGLEVEKVELLPDPGPRGQAQTGNSLFLWARAPQVPEDAGGDITTRAG